MYVDMGGEGPVGQNVLVHEDEDADAAEERCDDDSEYLVLGSGSGLTRYRRECDAVG